MTDGYYSSSFPGERQRLREQGQLLYPIFSSLRRRADKIITPQVVIDLGCADGQVTKMWFSGYEKVYGLDLNNEAIRQSRADEQFSFAVADITTPEGIAIIEKLSREGPVLVAMTLVLHNISAEKQEWVLGELRECLPAGSLLAIITSDHQLFCCWPEKTFKAMLESWQKDNRHFADPAHGRKLVGQLSRAGWRSIDFSIDTITLPEDIQKREEIFYIFNDFRRQRDFANPKEKQEMDNLLDDLKREYLQPDFFFQAPIFSALCRND